MAKGGTINQSMFDASQAGVNELYRAAAQKQALQQEGQNSENLARLKDALQGQTQQTSLERLRDFLTNNKDILPEGSGVAVTPEGASVTRGFNPMQLAQQGPHQAQAFLKNAQSAYKDINKQLDAAQGTLTLLNQGTETADKQALLNEVNLALSGSGSRAVGQVVDLFSGGKTANGTLQDKLNWLNNTPNLPTMQPAQRNALREAVFARIPQIEQNGQMEYQALAQQGPIIAPQADTMGLLNSMAQPIQQKLGGIKKMHQDYMQEMGKIQQPQASQPAQANPAPSTLDRLASFFGRGGQSSQPQQGGLAGLLGGAGKSVQQPQQQAPQGAFGIDPNAIAAELQRRQQSGMGQ